MTSADDASTRARLRSELEAARLDGAKPEAVLAVARELLETALEHDALDDARAALVDVEAALDPDDPGHPMIADYYRARIAARLNDGPGAVAAAERAVAVARANDFHGDLPYLLDELANAYSLCERSAEALTTREEAVQGFEGSEQHGRAGLAWAWLAEHGPTSQAVARFARARECSERADVPSLQTLALLRCGVWHAERNEYLPARQALERGLAIARQAEDPTGIAQCLEHLAWLEVEAFNHEEGIRVAGLALEAAEEDWQRGRALDARATAHHRLHDHLAARVDLRAAARAFAHAGEREWSKDCLRRADGDRILHWLHYLPSWVFRDKDMSTRESAFRKQRQPLYWWAVGALVVWPLVALTASGAFPQGALRTAIAFGGLAPLFAIFALVVTSVVSTKISDWRNR